MHLLHAFYYSIFHFQCFVFSFHLPFQFPFSFLILSSACWQYDMSSNLAPPPRRALPHRLPCVASTGRALLHRSFPSPGDAYPQRLAVRSTIAPPLHIPTSYPFSRDGLRAWLANRFPGQVALLDATRFFALAYEPIARVGPCSGRSWLQRSQLFGS